MIKITSVFSALMILIGNIFTFFLPKAPEPLTMSELMNIKPAVRQIESSDTVYAVDLSGFSEDERYSAICLQGIVAKTNPCIYLLFGSVYNEYLSAIEKTGKEIIRTDKTGAKWSYRSLIAEFYDYISDGGYTLYRYSEYAEGLNTATNFASAYGWLPVAESLKETAEECGLQMKKDLTAEEYDYSFQRRYFNELKDHFTKGAVVHLKYEKMGLRDFAIQQGYFCFYTLNDNFFLSGNSFMREVLNWSGENTAVYGWCEYEKKTVTLLSKTGAHIIASDYSYNCSYLSQIENDVTYPQKQGKAHTDPSKHYATLVFSDGDNCQWLQNGFSEYFSFINNYPDTKVSWTFSPKLKDMCPSAYDRIKSAANENTSFLCGPSGAGYCNTSLLDSRSLQLFSTETASAMLRSGERIITLLDDYKPVNEGKMKRSFDYFSRFENIDGGILFLDPDRYTAGKGKVWFSNDKPFASVRLSLWSDEGYEGATDEWISQQADILNSYPVDISSIEGYSVICVHAWTMKPEALNKFISLIAPHVEILSADDFIATMKENIPHKTAMPMN